MLFGLSQYLAVFLISVILFLSFQTIYNRISVVNIITNKMQPAGRLSFCFMGCLSLFPVIAMYGLRYGIGTDYSAYEEIYNILHYTPLPEYLEKNARGLNYYYVEYGYYFLNRIFPSYRTLLWGIGCIIFSLFCLSIKEYSEKMNYAFALFIFLSTQYIYSLNGMRFIIAVTIVLSAYNALLKNKPVCFIVFILLASLFHKTALFCLALFFLKDFKWDRINSTRNILLFVGIILFPLIGTRLLGIIGRISFFSRYSDTTVYSASDSISRGWTWILHIIPIIIPPLLFFRKEIFSDSRLKTLFLICMMEIPFRMLGLYNTWYTRFSRYSQIALVLFLPLLLERIENRSNKLLMYGYYTIWFIFYFAYYAIINDRGDSLPYVWVLSQLLICK